MKTLRRILFIILCFVIVVITVGFLLPVRIHVARKAVLSASPIAIFDQVNTLKNWAMWSHWLQKDPNAKVVFSGPESGVGASFAWVSNDKDVGSGQISIISSASPDSLELIYDFGEKGKSTGKFFFVNENQKTNVVISLDSDLGMNPISRWIGLFSDKLIGPDLVKDLNNLDLLIQDTLSLYGYKIVDSEIPGRILITIRDTAGPVTVKLKLAEMYKNLSIFLKSKGISPIGNPVAIFHTYSSGHFDIEAGIPVVSSIAVPLGLNCIEIGNQRSVKVEYAGPYQKIGSAYIALEKYIKYNNLKRVGFGWEEYATNPYIETDPDKQQTYIYCPVK